MKVKVKMNTDTLVKVAGILSNTVVLGSNIYLIASGFTNTIANNRRERNVQNLQLASQVATSLAGVTKVLNDISELHHAQNSEDI